MVKFLFLLMCCSSFTLASAVKNESVLKPLIAGVTGTNEYMPSKLHIESDTLYVCTSNGLVIKSLKTDDSHSVIAFEGYDIVDYAKNGNKILGVVAARFSHNEKMLLISNDGGKTCEDFTPDCFKDKYGWIISMVQHPTDKNTILIIDAMCGLSRTTDFGKHWEVLNEIGMENPHGRIEYHPLHSEIICYHSEDAAMQAVLSCSYDNGATWNYHNEIFSEGDNCMHQIAFHPKDKNQWIFSGEGIIGKTTDCGETWKIVMDDFISNKWDVGYLYNIVWDTQNPNFIYCSSFIERDGKTKIEMLVSANGGETWEKTFVSEAFSYWYDMIEYEDKLIIYNEQGVYMVDKSDLMPVTGIHETTESMEAVTVAGDCIYLNHVSSVSRIDIFDSNGSSVYTVQHPQNPEISIGGLEKGVYVLSFQSEGNTYTRKIVR